MIFDSHSHYDDEAFNEDRDSVLSSLKDNNVGHIIAACADFKSIPTMLDMCDKYDFIHLALGIHPNYAQDLTEINKDYLESLVEKHHPVAIGEIGLDYYYDTPSPEVQREGLIYQLKLADKFDLPVIIHSRDAAQETFDIIKEYGPSRKGVIHCFSSSLEMACEYVKLGYFIGIGGTVTFKNAKNVKNVVSNIPLESILLETDCPYLAPTPFRGQRNSSALLPYVVKEIAELKGVSEETVIDVTEKNAAFLFNVKI